MASEIVLEIVTPEGSALKEAVTEFTAPSVQGEFGVLPGHMPVLAALRTGIVRWRRPGGDGACVIAAGFIEFSGDHATILTDRCATKESLDPVRIRADLKDIDEKIDSFHGEHDSAEFQALVYEELWCAAELELNGDPPPPTVNFAFSYGQAPDQPLDEEPAKSPEMVE